MSRPQSLAITALLTMLSAVPATSTDMYLPSMPELARVFGADVARVQLTLSVFLIGFAVGQLLYGSLSDRYGRRPVLLAGLALYLAATVACAFSPSVEILIGARFLQAVGACSAAVIARAVVRDVHGPLEAARLLAHMASAMALAPMVAPIVGSYLTAWYGWRATFYLLTGFGVLSILAVAFMLDETNARKDPHALRGGHMASYVAELMRHPTYLGYVLTVAMVFTGFFSFLSGASFVLIRILGVPAEHFGFYFAIIAAGYMTGSQLAARLVSRYGIDPMVRVGTILAMVSGMVQAGIAWAGIATVATVLVPQFFFMIAMGIVLPSGMAAAATPFPRMAGLASAVVGFVQMAMAAIIGTVVGHFYNGTVIPMTTTTGIMGCLALMTYWLLVWRHRAKLAAP